MEDLTSEAREYRLFEGIKGGRIVPLSSFPYFSLILFHLFHTFHSSPSILSIFFTHPSSISLIAQIISIPYPIRGLLIRYSI